MSLTTTPSQTVGPFLHIGLDWLVTDDLAGPGVSGKKGSSSRDASSTPTASPSATRSSRSGRRTHTAATRIPDDKQDKPLEPGFKGFGRAATGDEGSFRFTTIKPGRVPAPEVACRPRISTSRSSCAGCSSIF
jgi:protocatechuate 3,4-dioxygenase alpha subunit